MQTPWMLVAGCSIVGWFVPEVIAVIGKTRIPVGMNVLAAVAGALISGSFVL